MANFQRPRGIRDYSQQELLAAAYAAAAKEGRIKRPDLFVRQIFRESKFDQDKPGKDTELGVAQITDALYLDLSSDTEDKYIGTDRDWRWNPIESLDRAAKYMSELLSSYGQRWDSALAAYNAGKGRAAPEDRPLETHEYIWFVTGLSDYQTRVLGRTLKDEAAEGASEPPDAAEELRAPGSTLDRLRREPFRPPPNPAGGRLAGGEPDPLAILHQPYWVLPGDTLSGIAAKFGVTVGEIARVNGIADRNKIQAETWILIPPKQPTSGPVGSMPAGGTGELRFAEASLPQTAATGSPAQPEPAAPAAEAPKVVVEKGRSDMAPQFKDPAGNVLAPGSREIKYFGGDTSRPVIDKGDGSFLTPGNPKDAQWTADRLGEGKKLGLDTEGWWEGNPVSIQSAINQAQIKKQTAPPPAPPAPVKTTAKAEAAKAEAVVAKDDWKQEIEREKLQLQREAQEDERRLAWFKAVSQLRGPRDWTSYWNTLRGGPESGLPVWLTKLGEGATLPAYGTVEKTPSEEAWARVQAQRALPGWVRQLARSAWPDWKEETAWPAPAPQQVGLKQYANLLPSEREGLEGIIERTGGYAADWLDAMQRSWPQWGRAPRTRFVK